jgi:soluble lytic murein transglycosylase-like protein
MFSVTSTLRLLVALIAIFAAAGGVASAAGDDELQYATLLRTINPHLQVHQSLTYARSLVADAERSNLDPRLIVALVTVESHWRPNAISPVGARGLGQLMPGTAAILGVNAWDPTQNIRGAATYLRAMMDHFAGRGGNTLPFAIGAYNAGPKAVDRYHGIPPYTETQNYVRKVLAMWRRIKIRLGARRQRDDRRHRAGDHPRESPAGRRTGDSGLALSSGRPGRRACRAAGRGGGRGDWRRSGCHGRSRRRGRAARQR